LYQVVHSINPTVTASSSNNSDRVGAAAETSVSAPPMILPLDPRASIVHDDGTPSFHEATSAEIIRGALAGHDAGSALAILRKMCEELETAGEDTYDEHTPKRQHRADPD
jgi:hypothetical protein